MRAMSLAVDVGLPSTTKKKFNLKKGEIYVFSERFITELISVYGEAVIEKEVDVNSFYKLYNGQDLTDKTLFCFRTSGIGDFMAMLVPLRILKQKYPTCRIIVGGGELNRYLAESDPIIDEFVSHPYHIDYLKDADYAHHFQGMIEYRSEESMTINFYDLFLKHLGIDFNAIDQESKIPKLYLDQSSERFIKSKIKKLGDLKKPIIGICPEASTIVRSYLPQYVRELVSLMNVKGLPTIIIGEPRISKSMITKFQLCDEEMSFDFAQYSNSLERYISIVNCCDVIISPDTATLHIAGALGKPMIGIFGPIPSLLRIKYFKNAIGLDCKTKCAPCFRHINLPCKYAKENKYSPCMYLATPERVNEILTNNILPLFDGFTRPIIKHVEAPEQDVDTKKALVTLAIGEQATDMLNVAKSSFELYASKIGADFIVIDTVKINGKFPNLEKFQIKQMLDNYDRIIYVDVDVLIHPKCPNLFEIVPKDAVGFVPDCPSGTWGNINRFNEISISQNALGQLRWSSGYFNSGVLVLSKEHKGLFDNPEDREKMNCQFRDQTLINYNFQKHKFDGFILDKVFNGMEITGFSSRIANPNKTNAMIMHFAHEGDRIEHMKKVALLFDEFDHSNIKADSRPILFYDCGELGWSMYLVAHIKYLLELGNLKQSVSICTYKDRFVLYKDLGIEMIEIPITLANQFSNLDQDGTHLYDHETKKRVKNDALSEIFQSYFQDCKVMREYGFFNGMRKFFKYTPTKEAKITIDGLIKSKPFILVFPRKRIGKFGKRNLSKEFYVELCNRLCDEYPEHHIISIGSSKGAYELDEIEYDNFIDFVSWKDEQTLDMLVALCNNSFADLAIGSQSALPKISLLCGVPTFIIGHERLRHTKTENWMNTKVDFYEVKDGDYDTINVEECIKQIIRFGGIVKPVELDDNSDIIDDNKAVRRYVDTFPILFYDFGEIGWTQHAVAFVKWLRSRDQWRKIVVVTSKSKFVFYRDACDELVEFPNEIKNAMKGFEAEQHFMMSPDKTKRISHPRMNKLLKRFFPHCEIFNNFDKMSKIPKKFYSPYFSNLESRRFARDLCGKEKAIIIFPRKRTGLYGHRNLSERFWMKLIPELLEAFKSQKIVSIGSKDGAYSLSIRNPNFIDLVNYDDDKTLEILVAICNTKSCSFTVGPQSGPSKIALLCGTPSFMIGHERQRHVDFENWANTSVDFFDANKSEDGYTFDEDLCIQKIIEFGNSHVVAKDFVFDENIICPTDPTATPQRIEQYKSYYKVKYDICKQQDPKMIIEIGVRAGYSAWTFLQACPNAAYIGIDANNGTHGGKGGEDGSFFKWTRKILSNYNFNLIEANTQTMDDLGFKDVDFIHVDGNHTTKGVFHDLDLAYKAINKDGLILIDDITYIDTVKIGVDKWLEKMADKVTYEFKQSLRGEMLIRRREG